MKQYLELLDKILTEGVEKKSGRPNMPNTIGLSNAIMRFDLADGFPLVTTKKLYHRGIIHELLWFLRGDTNIKYLVDNNVNIWNGDAYRWYLKNAEDRGMEPRYQTIDAFIDAIKKMPKDPWENCNKEKQDVAEFITGEWDNTYRIGDLGKVYGYQWRNQNGVDQVAEVINGLQTNPYSRYHIIDGWNRADFKDMALPPCHLLYQFIVRPINNATESEPKFYLDLNMYQRSCDTALGVPFNIASMSLLLHIVAKTCNMIPGIATWMGGDTHLYVNHIEKAKEQIAREPLNLPELKINKELNNLDDICNLSISDFEIVGYKSHDTIKFPLFVGLK